MIPDESTAPQSPEETLWKGYTSNWVHLGFYLLCVAIAVAAVLTASMTGGLSLIGIAVAGGMAGIRWWVTRATEYELTSQRLRIRSGILTRKLDELELYRVKDYTMVQPLLLRLIGRGNLTMVTSDVTCPNVAMKAIADVEVVLEKLRQAVQSERDRKRVRELDMGGGDEL